MLQMRSRVSLGTGLPNAESWSHWGSHTSGTVSQHARWETAVRIYQNVVLCIMYKTVCVSADSSTFSDCIGTECVVDLNLCVLEPNPDQALNVVNIELPRSTYPSIKGRIKDRANFWEVVLQASPFVMKIVTEGYQLPFIQPPTPFNQPNHNSALREREFVKEEIAKLVSTGCVEEVP